VSSIRLDSLAPESLAEVSAKTSGVRAYPARLDAILSKLDRTFGRPFSLVCAESGELVQTTPTALNCEIYNHLAVLKTVSQRGTPEIIEEESPLALLAIPLGSLDCGAHFVAVALFVTEQVTSKSQIVQAAKVFDMDASRALAAVQEMEVWPARLLVKMAEVTLENLTQQLALSQTRNERNEAVAHAGETYV